jgi:hypothetical protein
LTSNPTINQILTFDGVNWTNTNLNFITDLASLSDVSIINPLLNSQILQYNSVSQKWENSTILTSSSLQNLID